MPEQRDAIGLSMSRFVWRQSVGDGEMLSSGKREMGYLIPSLLRYSEAVIPTSFTNILRNDLGSV